MPVKLFKWFLCATFFIIGTGFLVAAEINDSIRPVYISILCYGLIYWLSKSFFGLSKKLLVISTIIVGGSALISYLFYFGFDIMAGWNGYDYFVEWALWAYAIGLPVMGYSFLKFD